MIMMTMMMMMGFHSKTTVIFLRYKPNHVPHAFKTLSVMLIANRMYFMSVAYYMQSKFFSPGH